MDRKTLDRIYNSYVSIGQSKIDLQKTDDQLMIEIENLWTIQIQHIQKNTRNKKFL